MRKWLPSACLAFTRPRSHISKASSTTRLKHNVNETLRMARTPMTAMMLAIQKEQMNHRPIAIEQPDDIHVRLEEIYSSDVIHRTS
jgi:hypothetical protein